MNRLLLIIISLISLIEISSAQLPYQYRFNKVNAAGTVAQNIWFDPTAEDAFFVHNGQSQLPNLWLMGQAFVYDDLNNTIEIDWDGIINAPTPLQGEQGPQGIQGPAGETGATGPKGDKGDKGDTGEAGPKGDKGDDGDTGPQGSQGETGEKGEKGDKGDTGEQGIQGIQGPKGDKGDQGDEGPQGPQGPKGDKGDQGDPGVNLNPAQGTRVQTATNGTYTWTFPEPYESGVIPLISIEVENNESNVTWSVRATAVSNTSVSVQIRKQTLVTLLGIDVVQIATNHQSNIHIIAIKP